MKSSRIVHPDVAQMCTQSAESDLALKRTCLTESIYRVVLQKSILARIRQPILILVIIKDMLTDLCGK